MLKNYIKIRYSTPPGLRLNQFFFSRAIFFAKFKYWLTELEIANIIWVIKKVKYIVKFFTNTTIIYTDYGINIDIIKQTFLTTASTDKLNLRLIRASKYF